MHQTNLLETALYVALLLAASSPAIWLLCAAQTVTQRTWAVLLLAVSLIGFQGLRQVEPPQQVNLYNYGESIGSK